MRKPRTPELRLNVFVSECLKKLAKIEGKEKALLVKNKQRQKVQIAKNSTKIKERKQKIYFCSAQEMFSMALGAHSIPGIHLFTIVMVSIMAIIMAIIMVVIITMFMTIIVFMIRRVRVSSECLFHEAARKRGRGHEKVHCAGETGFKLLTNIEVQKYRFKIRC